MIVGCRALHRGRVQFVDVSIEQAMRPHLDAMWAGLESGVPTINGYSGGTPVGWRSLEDSNVRGVADLYFLEDHLAEWSRTHGRNVRRIWWIGGPLDGWVVGEE